MDIALAYREVETAEQLLEEIQEAMSRHVMPDIRDAFGRPVGGMQLAVRSGKDTQRLFDLPWSLAKPVIEAHIALHKSRIAALNAKVLYEAADDGAVAPDAWRAAP
jgi:hypothetical protein